MSDAIRVLVVEDIQETLSATIDELREDGITVDIAQNVAKAGSFLRSADYRLLIVDMRIPLGDEEPTDDDGGKKLLVDLRAGKYGELNREVPFIVVSAERQHVDFDTLDGLSNCLGVYDKWFLDRIEDAIERGLAGEATSARDTSEA